MTTMAYYFLKRHSKAQASQAQLFQPLPRTRGTKGQAATPGKQTSPRAALSERFPQSKARVSALPRRPERVPFCASLPPARRPQPRRGASRALSEPPHGAEPRAPGQAPPGSHSDKPRVSQSLASAIVNYGN